jgi:UDP-glucose 4-epimerase
MSNRLTSNAQNGVAPANRRVVVLGGLGFMGSHISRALVRRGYSVRIFDKLYAVRRLIRDIEPEVEIVEGDISRPDDVIGALNGIESVIHLVHTTVPGSSMKDSGYDVSSNVVASAKWLARLSETSVKRILYFSSGGTVYGVPQTNPIDESHPTDPISSYGITKLAIEKYVGMFARMFGIEHRILRPSNVYGEGQRLNIGQGVIGVMADRTLRGLPLEVWGTGTNLRDYLHVEDLVAATLLLMEYKGNERVFNISSGVGRSLLNIIDTLRDESRLQVQIKYLPPRGFDVPDNVLSNSRLQKETGWQPQVKFETGIRRVVDWLRTTRDGK